MVKRTTKLRWRRRLKRSKKQVEDISSQAEQHFDKHLLRRITRLTRVRRFVISWILLFVLLAAVVIYQTKLLENYYLQLSPVAGGTYSEGILGNFTNANPLFSSNSADNSVSKLIFAGLLKNNQKNQLVGDLAGSWKVDSTGLKYIVNLRNNLKWQDGKPLTSADVVYTYSLIQNPDSGSPLAGAWQNIKISAPTSRTVVFELPSALSSFPYSLTNGIVPKHLLKGIPLAQLRSIPFNTISPVGAGPFKLKNIEVEGNDALNKVQRIALAANENYHFGKPKLSGLTINVFRDQQMLIDSFNKKELNAVSGLTTTSEEIQDNQDIESHNIPLSGETLVFFNNSSGILSDKTVRKALALGTNVPAVIKNLDFPVTIADAPLLKDQLGYSRKLAQLPYNLNAAKKTLSKAGWKVGKDGVRVKKKRRLSFSLYSQSNSDYAEVTRELQQQWRQLGVDARVFLQSDNDLQTTIGSHGYNALVYGITIGKDPDVFAYWHSTQSDVRSRNRLNFSEYKNADADAALAEGRNRLDPKIRTTKYHQFLTQWRQDAPAIALFQPRYLHITRGQVFNFNPVEITTGTDRFSNVENWMINQKKLPL